MTEGLAVLGAFGELAVLLGVLAVLLLRAPRHPGRDVTDDRSA